MKNKFLNGIWQVREKLAARFDYDLHRMVVHLQEAQAKHGDRLVPAPKQSRPMEHAIIEEVWRVRDQIINGLPAPRRAPIPETPHLVTYGDLEVGGDGGSPLKHINRYGRRAR